MTKRIRQEIVDICKDTLFVRNNEPDFNAMVNDYQSQWAVSDDFMDDWYGWVDNARDDAGDGLMNNPIQNSEGALITCNIVTKTGDLLKDTQGEAWNIWITNMQVSKNNDTGELCFSFDFELNILAAKFLIKLYDKNNALLDKFYSEPIYLIYLDSGLNEGSINPTNLKYKIPIYTLDYINYVEFGIVSD